MAFQAVGRGFESRFPLHFSGACSSVGQSNGLLSRGPGVRIPAGAPICGGYSSVVRAPDCGSGSRGFNSHHPPHFFPRCADVGVSPSGKARDFDSRIRRFDPCHPSHPDPLAQLAEHLTFNQGVPRSSRGWVTIFGQMLVAVRAWRNGRRARLRI